MTTADSRVSAAARAPEAARSPRTRGDAGRLDAAIARGDVAQLLHPILAYPEQADHFAVQENGEAPLGR